MLSDRDWYSTILYRWLKKGIVAFETSTLHGIIEMVNRFFIKKYIFQSLVIQNIWKNTINSDLKENTKINKKLYKNAIVIGGSWNMLSLLSWRNRIILRELSWMGMFYFCGSAGEMVCSYISFFLPSSFIFCCTLFYFFAFPESQQGNWINAHVKIIYGYLIIWFLILTLVIFYYAWLKTSL